VGLIFVGVDLLMFPALALTAQFFTNHPLAAQILDSLSHQWGFFDGAALIVFLATVGILLTHMGGFIYWLSCVDRMHRVLLEATDGQYPITPTMAGLYHFIPVYCVYWVFRWLGEIARFVNRRLPKKPIHVALTGVLLLLGFLLMRGPLGLAIIFAVGAYISRRVRVAITQPVDQGLRDSKDLPIEAMFGRAIGLEQEGEWERAIALYQQIALTLQGDQDARCAANRARELQARIPAIAGCRA
jgi:hypothetical protein